MPFDTLGLTPALAQAAAASGFAAPTAIQAAAIPAILQGRDLRGSAQTGSGKTAAFSLPLLQRLAAEPAASASRRLRALVLVPTRELAAQVGETLEDFARHLPERLKIVVAVGGVSINPQMMRLRGGADIVVATPGRLLDLVEHNALALDAVSTLVLDEADRLFDLGFAEELQRILALLPARRQNLLFSATFPIAIQALADDMLHDPALVDVQGEPGTRPDIVQRAIEVDAARRTQLLRQLLKDNEGTWDRVLVFVATQHAAQTVAEKLYRNGIYAVPFHGDIAQGTRRDILAQFKQSRWDVVIATDLAARGLDIAQLPVVINYDLPRSPTDYIHRIGRTGRAGASGLAISFVSPATEAHFRLIEKRQGQRVPRERIAGFEPTEAAPGLVDTSGNGGIKGARPSKKDKLRAAAALAAAVQRDDAGPND
ncbi:superfamily II DNA/RNA helicase [Variovorax boronicumulans]|uniref:DEAD/DEAH box helicase n=2 Tax=Pseudomonadota TaxID=1224 RepID=UPI000BB36CAA|nr:DEAD/DEAH box helicase [Variovorax boronicumulans]MDP9920089.1 superfamily II DNA/RNA helicase [Variovorax boronicumulans]PBI83338.1 ATP-dependent RNA helicase RhlE [Variovorax boronicumulans]